MPRLSVWFIRFALVNLFLGFTFGALMLWNKGLPLHPLLWRLLPAHMELLLLGWTVQLAMGVVYRILPRFLTKNGRTERGNTTLAWVALWLLNVGVWLAGFGPLLGLAAAGLLIGRMAEVGAAVAFALHAWPRVKPTRT